MENQNGIIKIVESGHLWLGVTLNSKKYTLTYNYGIDCTLIMLETESETSPFEYINYFHGGFNHKTYEIDSDILENAKLYIEEAERVYLECTQSMEGFIVGNEYEFKSFDAEEETYFMQSEDEIVGLGHDEIADHFEYMSLYQRRKF